MIGRPDSAAAPRPHRRHSAHRHSRQPRADPGAVGAAAALPVLLTTATAMVGGGTRVWAETAPSRLDRAGRSTSRQRPQRPSWFTVAVDKFADCGPAPQHGPSGRAVAEDNPLAGKRTGRGLGRWAFHELGGEFESSRYLGPHAECRRNDISG
jgi:hypothetical protein